MKKMYSNEYKKVMIKNRETIFWKRPTIPNILLTYSRNTFGYAKMHIKGALDKCNIYFLYLIL